MKRWRNLIALFSVLAVALVYLRPGLQAEESSFSYEFANPMLIVGDDPSFSSPIIDTTNWTRVDGASFLFSKHRLESVPEGIFWIRIDVAVKNGDDSPKVLFDSVKGAREVYWDGRLLGSTGVVSNGAENETPGLARQWLPIPREMLVDGIHTLAFRVSSNHESLTNEGLVDDLAIWSSAEVVPIIASVFKINDVTLGLAALSAVVFLLLYFLVDKKPVQLSLGICCLGVFAFLLTRYIWARTFADLLYPDEVWLYQLAWISSVIVSLSTLASVVSEMSWKSRYWILLPAAILIGAMVAFRDVLGESLATAILLVGLLSSLIFCLALALGRKRGSFLCLLGIAAFTAGLLVDSDQYAQVGFFVFVGSSLFRSSMELRILRSERELALRTAVELKAKHVRAEADLLKKSIQPHFLINTLTALIEWVVEDPVKGVEMIKAIEKHFDLLLSVSKREEIPLAKELELCDSFLEIMSFRKLVEYRLERSGVDGLDTVPPLLIHTLVENGVTHGANHDKQVTFTFDFETVGRKRIYTLCTPYSIAKGGIKKCERGTGLRYAGMRLQECYPERWKLNSTKANDLWVTTIEIQD